MNGSTAAPARVRWAVCGALLALYLAVVLVILLWPTQPQQSLASALNRLVGFLHNSGIPAWFDLPALEFTANIAMFVPLGFLVALALPQRAFWWGLLLLPAFSGVLEFSQGFLIPQRLGTLSDVRANTIGGYLGMALAAGLRAVVHLRDRLVVAHALAGGGEADPRPMAASDCRA